MHLELDHLFVCTAAGAPEAEEFLRFGLREAPANQHSGQGTANRRFSFANAMIELLWVSDTKEVQNESTRRTLLWERWNGRKRDSSPFGIIVRPADSPNAKAPFPGWEYRPAYLPDPLSMHVAESGVEEPMWVYLSFMRRVDREQKFIGHPIGLREITALTLTTPLLLRSPASQTMVKNRIVSTRLGEGSLLEIEFDGNRRNQMADFRPHLPLVFRL